MKRFLLVLTLAIVTAGSAGCNTCNSCNGGRPRLINWDFFSFGRNNNCETSCNTCGAGGMMEGPMLLPSTPAPTTTRILPGPVEESLPRPRSS